MQTRRARLEAIVQERQENYLSNREFLESMAMMQPEALRRLSNALHPVARQILPDARALLPPRGDYRYGERELRKYLYELPSENDIIANVLREYKDPISGVITPNPNFTANNNAALRHCTEYNYENCVRLLLKNPLVDVNVYNGAPLQNAIENKNLNMIRALVDRGAVITQGANTDETLSYAIYTNKLDIVKYFVEEKNVDIIRANDYLESRFVRSFAVYDYVLRKYIEKHVHLPNSANFNQDEFDGKNDIIISTLEEVIGKRSITIQQKIELATFLSDIGFVLNIRGNTLFNIACNFCDSLPLLQFLIARGFHVSSSAFNNANKEHCYEIIRFLISLVPVGGAVLPN